jgi:hypothetical protein
MSFKPAFFIALILLLVTNLVWLYIFVNQSVSYDYTREEYKHRINEAKLMRELMLDFSKDKNKKEIMKIIKLKYSSHILKEENGIFFIDSIGLKFDEDKLTKIIFMNES